METLEGVLVLQEVFDHSPTGLALLASSEGRVVRVNPALARLAGIPESRLEGRLLGDVVRKEARADHLAALARALEQGHRPVELERHTTTSTGREVYVRFRYVSVPEAPDGAPDVIAFVEDVTAQHRAAQAAERAADAVREAYREAIDAATEGQLRFVSRDVLLAETGEPASEGESSDDIASVSPNRKAVVRSLASAGLPMSPEFEAAVGEALANGIRHGGAVWWRTYRKGDVGQVLVEDDGPGISLTEVPRALLVAGYSKAASLGLGFTIMLAACSRLHVASDEHGTLVLLEAPGGFGGTMR